MCHKIINSLMCTYCNEKAVAYRACTDDSGNIHDCDEYLIPETDDNPVLHDVICVKSDNATEITFICGWCATYIHCGNYEEGRGIPCSQSHIYETTIDPMSANDYMIYTLRRTSLPVDVDAGLSGYKDKDGNVTVVFTTYEQAGYVNTTIVYSTDSIRR